MPAGTGTTFIVSDGNNIGVIYSGAYTAELIQFFVQDENYGYLAPAMVNRNNSWSASLTNDRRLSIANNTGLSRKAHVLIFEKL